VLFGTWAAGFVALLVFAMVKENKLLPIEKNKR